MQQQHYIYQLLNYAQSQFQRTNYSNDKGEVTFFDDNIVVTDKTRNQIFVVLTTDVLPTDVHTNQRLEMGLTPEKELKVLAIALDCITNHGRIDKANKPKTYKLIRYYTTTSNDGQRVMKTGMTLEETQNYCLQKSDTYVEKYVEE